MQSARPFYLLVAVIVVVAVFPFYYAIVTSFKSGTALFEVDYWPTPFSLDNYVGVFTSGELPAQPPELAVRRALTVVASSLFLGVTAAYALAASGSAAARCCCSPSSAVSMFPQIAVLAGLFELIRSLGIYNTPWALIFSYTIFTLPFTVWVLTTFMRDLPIEIEEAAIVDGATPWVIITTRVPAADVAGAGDDRAARLHRRLERVPVRADLHLIERPAHRAGGDRAALGRQRSIEMPWGNIMAASVIVTVPLVVLVLIFQRKIVSGLTAGGVKG